MGEFLGYRCSICERTYAPSEVIYTCPEDGGNLDVLLDYEDIKNTASVGSIASSSDHSIWRYLPLLPVEDPRHYDTPLRAVGWTPLYRTRRLQARLGMDALWVKDEGRNPTASFKDRASAVVVAQAERIGAEVIITASTGNAGAALAGMAAAAGAQAVILAPKNAPSAKVAQLLIFDARVYLVDGSYDDAFNLTVEASKSFGWYCRNTGYNPFTAEGKKTAVFEICEQYTQAMASGNLEEKRWLAPEAVFVSVGDGNIISGLHKGFKDLHLLGWIEEIPRLFGIQSTGSAAIYNAFHAGTEQIHAVRANTIADSISVDLPRDGLRALRAVTETGGAYFAVEDEEILAALRDMAQYEGIFAEPAGATAYAGLAKAVETGQVDRGDRVVVLNTGNGLKDVQAAMQAAGEAIVIKPELGALQDALQAEGGE